VEESKRRYANMASPGRFLDSNGKWIPTLHTRHTIIYQPNPTFQNNSQSNKE
jgi:hypothetical protein